MPIGTGIGIGSGTSIESNIHWYIGIGSNVHWYWYNE